MSATVPFLALAALIGLSLGARQAARIAASTGRQIATVTLILGVFMSFWIFN